MHITPERVEKVTTQAHTPSICFAPFEIASVTTYESRVLGRIGVLFICFGLTARNGLNIIPESIAAKIMLTYIATPSLFDESIPPTPPITKAADGTFINVSRYSSSSFDISPLSSISDAERAPTGYPQRNPRAAAQEAHGLVPKISLRGFSKNLPMSEAYPPTVMSAEMIINGKSEGITVLRHRESPPFTCSENKVEPEIATAIIAIHSIGDIGMCLFLT